MSDGVRFDGSWLCFGPRTSVKEFKTKVKQLLIEKIGWNQNSIQFRIRKWEVSTHFRDLNNSFCKTANWNKFEKYQL